MLDAENIDWQECCNCPHDHAQIVRVPSLHVSNLKVRLLSTDLKTDLISMLPRLRRFAWSLTRSFPEADDLVQDTCLRALSYANQWDPTQPLDRWVFRIMRNTWISEVRKQNTRTGQGTIAAEDAAELSTRHSGEDSVAADQLYAQIASLPEDLSAVLLVVSVEGYSYADASKLFDIPIGTVMSRIHRARKALARKIVDPQGARE